MIEAETVRTDLGKMKVIAVFKLPKKSAKTVDMIFGAKIESGKVEKECQAGNPAKRRESRRRKSGGIAAQQESGFRTQVRQ